MMYWLWKVISSMSYNDKLVDMMEKIGEFKVVIQHFGQDINQYRT
ncbi:MAG: methyl-accepting chemotaxis sensory transducer with (heme) sensor [Firmicutes bacterium]|nr:methyl-accepting chemotaxis sensory transducer with (heme) sensor [Bacillota bacterium]